MDLRPPFRFLPAVVTSHDNNLIEAVLLTSRLSEERSLSLPPSSLHDPWQAPRRDRCADDVDECGWVFCNSNKLRWPREARVATNQLPFLSENAKLAVTHSPVSICPALASLKRKERSGNVSWRSGSGTADSSRAPFAVHERCSEIPHGATKMAENSGSSKQMSQGLFACYCFPGWFEQKNRIADNIVLSVS